MSETDKAPEGAKNHTQLLTQVITGVVGAALLALQGVNISETGSNTDLIRRVETALRQQSDLISHVTQEGTRIDAAIVNQKEMLDRLDSMIRNEGDLIELFKEDQKIHPR